MGLTILTGLGTVVAYPAAIRKWRRSRVGDAEVPLQVQIVSEPETEIKPAPIQHPWINFPPGAVLIGREAEI